MEPSAAIPGCGSLPTANALLIEAILVAFITHLAGQPVARVFRHPAPELIATAPFPLCIAQMD
jgi:hypothetical protein